MSVPVSNRVRIIGGRHRGRMLRFPGVPGARPTPDRVRETLFNWLGQDLAGRSTLEPYAGSGAMSLEALSRGATLAVAVDRDAALVRAMADNARLLGEAALELHRGDARAFLARESRRFDVVFLDPPFDEDPWPWLMPAARDRLADGGAIYAEARRALDAPAGLAVVRRGRAGQVHYHLLAKEGPPC
ncbi:MAG TPA: 16S rRNA (guanine(966)-N(2))-methyltransferase RsmD [Casimicrobiaceae bacterium]|nr:16S rRNA (guanine(966)-N(2))-methyltransferase RsmD [Casimicrobiaceae bacterium]